MLNKKQIVFKENQKASSNYDELLKKHQFTPKNKRPALRKYVFYNSEKGEEATWLANDIKRFMPKGFKTKWKGYQHSELQRKLAFYDRHTKQDIKELLSGCEFDHFLLDINACFKEDDFEDFFSKYLKNRIETLKDILVKLNDIKNEPTPLKARFLTSTF